MGFRSQWGSALVGQNASVGDDVGLLVCVTGDYGPAGVVLSVRTPRWAAGLKEHQVGFNPHHHLLLEHFRHLRKNPFAMGIPYAPSSPG